MLHSLTTSVVRSLILLLAATCGIAASTSLAQATVIPVANFSFESPVTATFISNPALGGWTYVDNGAGVFNYVQVFDPSLPAVGGVTHGNQYLGLYTANVTTRMYLDTGVAWTANATYTLSLALGNRSGVIGATTIFGLSNNNTAASIQGTPTTVNTETAISKQDWETFTYSFVTGPIAPAGNVFIVVTKQALAGDARVQFDNVQLEFITVPEPSTLALLGLGVVGVAVRARRKARFANSCS